MELLLFAIVGAVAGWLAGRLMRSNGFGLAADLIAGVIAAVAGGYGFRAGGVELGGGLIGSLLAAFGSAMLLLFVMRLFTRQRGGRKMWS
jgi:uncharacterized membrane protein YeaQ/YmgE (transglycosylase-associated protein family)